MSLDISNTYQAYNIDPGHPAVEMIGRALAHTGLAPSLEATGGGSDSNIFIQKGIIALPVGIGVRSFHTTKETALIPEVLQAAEMCQRAIVGG